MLRETLQNIDTGVLAQIGLLFFLLAFVLLMIRTAFLVREKGAYAKNIPLNDLEETGTVLTKEQPAEDVSQSA